MRITNNMLINNMINTLQKNASRLDKYQTQLATGKKFLYPSDDPIVASRALKLRTDVSEIEQFIKNTSDAASWLDLTDTALKNFGDIVQRTRELTVQAGGATTPDDKMKILSEISELKKQLIEIGNTTYAGRYLFAGFETDSPPITVESMEIPAGTYVDRFKYNGRYMNLGGAMKVGDDVATVTGAAIGFPVTIDGTNDTLQIRLDRTTRTITLDHNTYDSGTLLTELQDKLNAAFGEDMLKASINGTTGQITFTTASEQELELIGGSGLDDLGHVAGTVTPPGIADVVDIFDGKRYMMDGKPVLKGGNVTTFNIVAGANSFRFTQGATTQTITIPPAAYGNVSALATAIQTQIDAEFGAPPQTIKVDIDDVNGRINFISMNNETITIEEFPGNTGISVLGFKDGYTAVANQKQAIEFQIGIANTVKVNVEGNEILGGIAEMFDTFNKIEMALNGEEYYRKVYDDGTTEVKRLRLTDCLTDIDKAHENILGLRADVGARLNYVELTLNRLGDDEINFTKLMSENEDADIAEVIMNLKNEENVYRSSLSAGARIIMPTLVDFLR